MPSASAAGKKRWYVVHAYSGMEKSVMRALKERIERAGMDEQFGQILVPTEEVVEVKNGQKAVTERTFFPGYVLVEMEMTDETWHLVKNTPQGDRLRRRHGQQADRRFRRRKSTKIMQQMQEGVEKPRPKVLFEVGETGARQGRPVHRLQRQCRGSQLREDHAAGVGHDLRSVDAGRAGFRAGREGLTGRRPQRVALRRACASDRGAVSRLWHNEERHYVEPAAERVALQRRLHSNEETDMAKKIVGFIKLQVPAGKANPSPADRPGAGPARPEHHGILQGVQRPDAEVWSPACRFRW